MRTVIFVGLIVRLLSVIFSEGYGMHDDHFLVVEAAGSWVDGEDYNRWLPWNKPEGGLPEGHSFTYVGLNYLLFSVLKFIGISDPKILMLLNRLVHALFSLLVIRFGYLITEKFAGKKTAAQVGWILALMWAMPFLSVRNLVEVTSIPLLMWAIWLSLQENRKMNMFYAGLLVGMAISFRYQIAVYAVGWGIYYLIKLEWRKLLMLTGGTIAIVLLTQGLVDYFIWGYPFAEFKGYVLYNMNEGTRYMANKNYFMYFYVLFGLLLFPLGILALIGYFRSAGKYLFLFLPTFAFLLFHSVFPNRQERFILTILPITIVMAFLGIELLRRKKFWNGFRKVSLIGFWILNIPLLIIVTVMPSKKSRVDSMYALYGKTKGGEHLLIEATGESSPEMLPFFYSGAWNYSISERPRADTVHDVKFFVNQQQDFILFFGEENLQQRIASFREYYPAMKLETQVNPGFVDKFLHNIKPRNSNSYIEVWKTNKD